MSTDKLLPNPEEASKRDIYIYQRMTGSLLYATCITRPDAARASSKLSEFLRNPSPLHDAAARRAIAYLYQTRTLAIEYSGPVLLGQLGDRQYYEGSKRSRHFLRGPIASTLHVVDE